MAADGPRRRLPLERRVARRKIESRSGNIKPIPTFAVVRAAKAFQKAPACSKLIPCSAVDAEAMETNGNDRHIASG